MVILAARADDAPYRAVIRKRSKTSLSGSASTTLTSKHP